MLKIEAFHAKTCSIEKKKGGLERDLKSNYMTTGTSLIRLAYAVSVCVCGCVFVCVCVVAVVLTDCFQFCTNTRRL